MGTIPLVETPLDSRNLTTILFYLGLFQAGQFAIFNTRDVGRQVIMVSFVDFFSVLQNQID